MREPSTIRNDTRAYDTNIQISGKSSTIKYNNLVTILISIIRPELQFGSDTDDNESRIEPTRV